MPVRVVAVALALLVLAPSCTTALNLSINEVAADEAVDGAVDEGVYEGVDEGVNEGVDEGDDQGAEVLGESAAADDPVPTTAPPTTTPPSTTTVPLGPLVLGFVGDVHMIRDLSERDPLGQVAPLLSAPDLTFANLETVVGERSEVGAPPIDKRFIFLSPPETLQLLAAAGVDVVGMANNHAWDYGPAGARSTAELVDESGLIGVGVGPTPVDAYEAAFVDVADRTLGVVSLTRVPCDWSQEPAAERPEVAWGCDRFDLAAIASILRAVEASDVTVVMLHGGVEVTDCPGPRLREIVSTWIDMGVDVVAISHPHVVQGVEVVDGAAVLWSTGNFVFTNNGGRTGRSAVFEVTLEPGADPSIRLAPTELPRGVARPAAPVVADAVFASVSERSPGGIVGVDGVLRADPAPSRCD